MSLSQGSQYPADAVEEFKATGKVVGFEVQDSRTDKTPPLSRHGSLFSPHPGAFSCARAGLVLASPRA